MLFAPAAGLHVHRQRVRRRRPGGRPRLSRARSATPARSTRTPRGRSRTTRRVERTRRAAGVRAAAASASSCNGNWLDAPTVAFYGVGNDSTTAAASTSRIATTTRGASAGCRRRSFVAVGGGFDCHRRDGRRRPSTLRVDPTYGAAARSPSSTRGPRPATRGSGGLYRVDWSDYRQTNAGAATASAASTPKCSSSFRFCARTG